MIALPLVPFRRIAPLSLICLFVPHLAAETRTTLVVRADERTGRLVRSVVVPSHVVTPVITPGKQEPEPQPAAPVSLAAGSITELIDAIAQTYNIEAQLVHSVIKAESNYNPVAVSPKGAQGIMQLIPSTARRFGVSNSFNVQQNIEGGVRYLKYLMDLYHDDYVKVIAAYNAGEGAVTKYGGIPPYSETVDYVYRVARYLKSARQSADPKAKVVAASTEPARSPEDGIPVHASIASDGKVYYKTP